MTTQVIFKIDKDIKIKAQKKAKSQGTTLSEVLKFATMGFIEDRFDVGFIYPEQSKKI